MSKNICCEKCGEGDYGEWFSCTNKNCLCHTTTQKKECGDHQTCKMEFNGECDARICVEKGCHTEKTPAHTPSINEIIEKFGDKLAARGQFKDSAVDCLRKLLTSFEANIRAEERDEWVKHPKGALCVCDSCVKEAVESKEAIYKELIDAIEEVTNELGHETMDLCENSQSFKEKVLSKLTGLATQIIKQKQEGDI